jgi:hypothetical protein
MDTRAPSFFFREDIMNTTANPMSMMIPKREITLLTLIADAYARGDDLTKIMPLLDIRDREEKRTQLQAFNRAIARAKINIPTILKNKSASFGVGKAAYKHADLAEIERTIRKPLGDEGLSCRFNSDVKDGMIILTCLLAHEDGHIEKNSLPGPADTSGNKNPIQAMGSTLTYLQRYLVMMSLGLAASEDDDANSVSRATITAEQVAELNKKLQEIGELLGNVVGLTNGFLNLYRIKEIEQLPADDFADAMKRIEAKRPKKDAA